MIAFSLPQEASADRRTLRSHLRWQGYAPLYDGLWVSPHPLTDTSRAELLAIAHGATTVFRARHMDIEALTSRAPIGAWDVTTLARLYDALYPALAWPPAWYPSWGACRRERGAGAYRGHGDIPALPDLDPQLPIRLMPAELAPNGRVEGIRRRV